jgi:hypothetical protein
LVYSDNLLMFLLKSIFPEKYRERYVPTSDDLNATIEKELERLAARRAGAGRDPTGSR